MSGRDVGMGEMHGFESDDEIEAVLTGRTAGDASDVAAFVGELRHAYAAEAIPAPTQALTELFARGLPVEETAPVAATPRRSRVLTSINRLGTAAKAVIAAVVLVGASTGLAAADLLPQPVDDTVSNVVPFVARDTADDDGTADQGPGDAPGTTGSDVTSTDPTTNTSVDDDVDDNSGPSENSGPGSVNSGSGSSGDDDDDDSPTSTPTTVDDDDSTATTIDDDDDRTSTTIDDGDDSGGDNSGSGSGSDDSGGDNSGSGSDDSGSGSEDD